MTDRPRTSAPGDFDRVLRSQLRLRHLQLVVALDEYRHLGRAAESLASSQPAVSKALAEIERLFGLTLFLRSTRGTEPTAHGMTVIRFARSVLADFDRARDELAATASGATGRVRVGAMVVATPGLLVPAVGALKASTPGTTVSIEEGDLNRLLPRLRTGELDLIVGRLEPGYAAPDLDTEALYDEAMVLIVAPGHPLAARRRLGWADLVGQPWVVPPPWASSRVKLFQQFYKHGLHPPPDVAETASLLVTTGLLEQRGAVGFVARSVAEHLARQGLACMLNLPVPIEWPPVGVIRLRSKPMPDAAERLLQALRAEAAGRRQAREMLRLPRELAPSGEPSIRPSAPRPRATRPR